MDYYSTGPAGQSSNTNPFYSNPSEPGAASRFQPDLDQQNGAAAADGPEIDDIEDLPARYDGYYSDSQVVRPYAIEEPNEDDTTEIKGPSPQQQGQSPYWKDLVDSMGDLYCDSSDNGGAGITSTMRGRKRKPASRQNSFQTGKHRKSSSVPDAQYARPSLSPKRPRKKDEDSRKAQRHHRSAQKERVRIARGLSGSSSASISTDASGPNPTNGQPAPDAMDLD